MYDEINESTMPVEVNDEPVVVIPEGGFAEEGGSVVGLVTGIATGIGLLVVAGMWIAKKTKKARTNHKIKSLEKDGYTVIAPVVEEPVAEEAEIPEQEIDETEAE